MFGTSAVGKAEHLGTIQAIPGDWANRLLKFGTAAIALLLVPPLFSPARAEPAAGPDGLLFDNGFSAFREPVQRPLLSTQRVGTRGRTFISRDIVVEHPPAAPGGGDQGESCGGARALKDMARPAG